MKNFPNPITTENFGEANHFIRKALTSLKRKSLIQKIVQPTSCLLFLFFSLLIAYGAILTLSDPEEMIVFSDLTFITKLWEGFSGLLTKPDMAWYLYWSILIAAAFVIPLIVAVLINIIVYIAYKPKVNLINDGTEAEKAKALHEAATVVQNGNKDFDNFTIVFSLIFTLAIAAFLAYAFFIVKIGFTVGMLIGMVIALVVIYFIYLTIFAVFELWLYRFYDYKRYSNLTSITDAYWLSVDADEVARRKAEEERKAREAEAARARAAQDRELGAQKRVRALEAERSGQYALAKSLFKEAAELGDALGMDNYARHCLINGKRKDAIYWLERSIETGEADDLSRALLRALKNGEQVDAHYN